MSLTTPPVAQRATTPSASISTRLLTPRQCRIPYRVPERYPLAPGWIGGSRGRTVARAAGGSVSRRRPARRLRH